MVNYFPGEKWPLRKEVVGALVADVARSGSAGGVRR
jgi:hypothetical protein